MVELCMFVDAHMMGGGREGGVVTGNVNLLYILVEFKRKNYNATFLSLHYSLREERERVREAYCYCVFSLGSD